MSTEKCVTCGKPRGDAHDAEMYGLAKVKRTLRLGESLRDPATQDIRKLSEPELEKLPLYEALTPERQDFEALLLEHVFLDPPYRAALTAWIAKVTEKRRIGT